MPVYVQSVIFCSGVGGLPVLFMYFYLSQEQFLLYSQTIPLRIFITILLCVIFLMWKRTQKTQGQTVSPEPHPISHAQPVREYPDKILVRSGNGIKVIPTEDLLFIQADGDYVSLVTKEGKWLKEETMKHLQETLSPMQFVRIHRSFIVNVSRISRIERYGEQQYIILTNGESIRISATGYKTLKETLRF